jgi:hypothetical protein
VDPVTAVCLFFVSWTVLMIFIYSVGITILANRRATTISQDCRRHDDRQGRRAALTACFPLSRCIRAFSPLISLFAFAMYLLVVSDNL